MNWVLFLVIVVLGCCAGAEFGPVVKASRGEALPKPQQQLKLDTFFTIDPLSFSFKFPAEIGCYNFLDNTIKRYWAIISSSARSSRKSFALDENYLGSLESLTIDVEDCPDDNIRPAFGDDESYILAVTPTEQTLQAANIWGILRGLETFSQLIYLDQTNLFINATLINDFPRFSHRGLLLDTSRHFQPIDIIYKMLDAMSYNKLNVFHWHITDDQSFPYKSRVYPELSDQGAYHPDSKVYHQSEIQSIIEYARQRGIRVIVEFDVPGHTRAWGESHPELLTTCYSLGVPSGELGPMNPVKNSTYDFLVSLFKELVDVFPDSYLHIGGDEVEFDCWASNLEVVHFMVVNNITDYEAMQNYFMQKVVDMVDNLGREAIIWEEAFLNGVDIKDFSTVVQVWRHGNDSLDILGQVVAANKLAIYSSCWYLDHLLDGGDWEKYYQCEPLDFEGTEAAKSLVVGGETCMWSESVNEYNVMQRVWPRASAAAERLWSNADVVDLEDARARMEEHTCRMNARGIAAQPPNGAGVCLF